MPLRLFKQKTALLSFKIAAGARRFSVVILCFLLFFFLFQGILLSPLYFKLQFCLLRDVLKFLLSVGRRLRRRSLRTD